ncbi:MAG: Ig-like domain-containing protein, partial [Nitrospiraceae bacterium]
MNHKRSVACLIVALAVVVVHAGLLVPLPVLAQTTTDYFLHGSGGTANPPTVFLNTTTPTDTTAKYKDSTSVNFSGGNPWKEVGTWPTTPVPPAGTLTAVQPVHVWLGLKNSDDQGTKFDLLAELSKNGVVVTSGLTRCITGITRNPDLALEVTASFGSLASEPLNGTSDSLALKLSTRIGTNPDNTKCAGHNNAVGLRLYFDSTTRQARLGLTTGSNPTPTSLTPNPLTIVVGATGTLTATIAPAPTQAGNLTVSSDNPNVATVPASVPFTSNQTQVPIPVTAVGVGTAMITASLNGGSATSTVHVT